MRTRHLATAFVIAAFAAGCTADSATSPTPADLSSVRQTQPAAADVPFKGSCVTTSTADPIGPGKLHILVYGQCDFTHLGKTQFFADQIANVAGGTLTGSNVFTAANGDQLYSVNSGPLGPPVRGVLVVGGDVTFTGGTGRFAHASGRGQFAGTVNVAAQTGANTWEGTIHYDASDRSTQ
jgi:hypothetical protein